MSVPAQKPHKSEQTVCTPKNFLRAVERRFGSITFDLAATRENCVAWPDDDNCLDDCYYGPDHTNPEFRDSLAPSVPWHSRKDGVLSFCNPPFGNITPWVRKATESKAYVAMLLPASIGSEWFAEWVHPHAYVLALRKRLTFDGHSSPYPKDLILCMYGAGFRGFDVWDWQDGLQLGSCKDDTARKARAKKEAA